MLRNRLPVATAAASLALAFAFHIVRSPDSPVSPVVDAKGSVTVEAQLSHRAIQLPTQDLWAQIELRASDSVATAERPPMDAVLIFDRSGSMAGAKLSAAKDAALLLTQQMAGQDRLALVTFDDYATVEAPLTWMNGTDRPAVDDKIRSIQTAGGTDIGQAYSIGRHALSKARPEATRVMFLVSDGQPTEGVVGPNELAAMAAKGRQEDGIALSTLGIGDGFSEQVLGSMATQGGGNFYYAENPELLAEQLDREWNGLSSAVARNLTVTLTPAPGVTIRRVHGFSTTRVGDSTKVFVDTMFGGSQRKLMVELAATASASAATPLIATTIDYDDLNAGGAARTAVDVANVNVVNRKLGPADVVSSVLGRARAVETAQAISASDERWGARDREGARGILRTQYAKNLEFINQWGRTPELEKAQGEIHQAERQLYEVIQEKRQIRIRKKRKVDTIEIISGG